MQKKYVAKLSKSEEKKQKASINEGKKAYAKGERLSKDYFADRQAIGGPSLEDEDEKEPGAVSGSTTAGNVLEDMRTQINLGDKGEAGTGTVTVPKGTPTQQREYADAVRRRQGSELQKKLDAQRKELQKSFSFDSSKPRAGLVYQSEEDKGREAVRKFFEEADEQTPVSDEPLSDEDKAENVAIEKEDRAERWKKAAGQAVERGKQQPKRQKPAGGDEGDEEDDGINGGGDPVKTSGAADVNAEIYADHIPGSEDMSPDELREASFDAAAKDYGKNFEHRRPATESTVEFDGVEYVKKTYETGEVFFAPTGEDGDFMRAHDDKARREKFESDKAKVNAAFGG